MKVVLINLITLSRIVLGIIIFLLLAIDNYLDVALILFMFAGLTDYLDGFLARRYSLTSQLGEILDPIADKILIIFLFFWSCVKFIQLFDRLYRLMHYNKGDLGERFKRP